MPWLLAAIASIGAVEVILRLPLMRTIGRFRSTLSMVSSVIGSTKISDHWKEKVVPIYALRLLRLTALTAAYMLLVFVHFIVLFVVAAAAGIPFFEFTLSLTGLLFTSIMALCYSTLRFASVKN